MLRTDILSESPCLNRTLSLYPFRKQIYSDFLALFSSSYTVLSHPFIPDLLQSNQLCIRALRFCNNMQQFRLFLDNWKVTFKWQCVIYQSSLSSTVDLVRCSASPMYFISIDLLHHRQVRSRKHVAKKILKIL